MTIRGCTATMAALAMCSYLALAAQDDAVPTKVLVRALARDAKVIGSGVGGARITIRDAQTGAILAQGMQEGGTGDTGRIMRQPHERYGQILDTPGTAHFLATIDLTRPTRVHIRAEGPLGSEQSTYESEKTLLLVPGKDILGEGIVLEIHGFLIEWVEPESSPRGGEIPVKVTVRMACGCPTEPGGLWDADHIEIVARLHRNGEAAASIPLTFAGETSTYSGTFRGDWKGPARIEVVASDVRSLNFGQVWKDIVLQ